MYCTRFWTHRSIRTRRESRISRGFEHFEAMKHVADHAFGEQFEALKRVANHVFHKVGALRRPATRRESWFWQGLNSLKHRNTPRITYFTRFFVLRGMETCRESRILRSCEHFDSTKHTNNHAFYDILKTSKHWKKPRITYFMGFLGPRSIETRHESRI